MRRYRIYLLNKDEHRLEHVEDVRCPLVDALEYADDIAFDSEFLCVPHVIDLETKQVVDWNDFAQGVV